MGKSGFWILQLGVYDAERFPQPFGPWSKVLYKLQEDRPVVVNKIEGNKVMEDAKREVHELQNTVATLRTEKLSLAESLRRSEAAAASLPAPPVV